MLNNSKHGVGNDDIKRRQSKRDFGQKAYVAELVRFESGREQRVYVAAYDRRPQSFTDYEA